MSWSSTLLWGNSEEMSLADAKNKFQECWELRLEPNLEFQMKAFQLHSMHNGKPGKYTEF